MRNPNDPCLFCHNKKKEYIFENELAYATIDTYPVSKFHCLIVPERHVKSYFELTDNEILACNKIIRKLKKNIEIKDKSVKGFNLGTNSGQVAGQSINHCHLHLIPRRKNDVKNPQGGVRAVISSKQHYIRKK